MFERKVYKTMSKEKQIDEIMETINSLYGCNAMYFGVDGYGIAHKLYDAGYRKQSEGEWIEHETAWGDVFYSCSVCGDERCAVDGSIWELGLNFCPNCGAKMKGGAER